MDTNEVSIIQIIMILCMVLLNLDILAQNHASMTNHNTVFEFNECSHLMLNNKGDTIYAAFCIKYRTREYSFQTTYVGNCPAFLRIYFHEICDNKLVAEFAHIKKKWVRYDYHTKSVPYRNPLLKKYLRMRDSVQYDQIETIYEE